MAATRLLTTLGYAADHVTFTPRLRCHGCPRYPFLATHLSTAMRRIGLTPPSADDGYTDFGWVSVERRFDARAVETDGEQGWAWWELSDANAAAAEIDAFRLLAVFLAHWDNKASNQGLVCLDQACSRPLAMLQDVGATFGPPKVNLARWRSEPIWTDRAQCLVSMARLPFKGATFPDARISEAGRALLAVGLAAISREQVRALFTKHGSAVLLGTDDERDLNAGVGVRTPRRTDRQRVLRLTARDKQLLRDLAGHHLLGRVAFVHSGGNPAGRPPDPSPQSLSPISPRPPSALFC